MKRIEIEAALLETVSALAVLLDGLGTPLGHPDYLDRARARLLAAMRALGAQDEPDTADDHRIAGKE